MQCIQGVFNLFDEMKLNCTFLALHGYSEETIPLSNSNNRYEIPPHIGKAALLVIGRDAT